MAIIGPIAPYSNVPINAQFYAPSRFTISAISFGATTTVTTTQDNDYVIGQLCRLIIPPSFGCRQLNETQSYVIGIPAANQVTLQLDSSLGVDPYIASSAATPAQILAIGDINSGVTNSMGNQNLGTFIPGSFIDISPN